MDDIYTDLENYNEINSAEELKKENEQLKSKLKEYTVALDKLQNDFNVMAVEFKKLEVNYSSLLKTARAEIERKTEIITNLNKTKDKLVLNSIQNGNFRRTIHKKNFAINLPEKIDSSVIVRDEKNRDTSKMSQKEESQIERTSEKRITSEDRGSVLSSDKSNKDIDKDIDLQATGKENVTRNVESHNDVCKKVSSEILACGIKNRRTTMPAISRNLIKCGSDGDTEDDNLSSQVSNKQYLSRNEQNIKFESNYRDNRSHRVDDTFYRSNYYESRENCRYYKHKYNRFDRKDYNTRSRNEQTYRFRRSTPEKMDSRVSRYYSNRHEQRKYGRERVLVSPPPYRYCKRKDQQASRQHKIDDILINHRHSRESQSIKHKIISDHDEHRTKRIKLLESRDEVVPINTQIISCESPDYVKNDYDNMPSIPVKEIMNTASVYIEDPRLKSCKYLIFKGRDKEILSTVCGREIDLKLLDWNRETNVHSQRNTADFSANYDGKFCYGVDPMESITTPEFGISIDSKTSSGQFYSSDVDENNLQYCHLLQPDIDRSEVNKSPSHLNRNMSIDISDRCEITDKLFMKNNDRFMSNQKNLKSIKDRSEILCARKIVQDDLELSDDGDCIESGKEIIKNNIDDNDACSETLSSSSFDLHSRCITESVIMESEQLVVAKNMQGTDTNFIRHENQPTGSVFHIANMSKMNDSNMELLNNEKSKTDVNNKCGIQNNCLNLSSDKNKPNNNNVDDQITDSEKNSNKNDGSNAEVDEVLSSKIENGVTRHKKWKNKIVDQNVESKKKRESNKSKKPSRHLNVKQSVGKLDSPEKCLRKKEKKQKKGCVESMKIKANELFGDSNSLITPEDLEIPSPNTQCLSEVKIVEKKATQDKDANALTSDTETKRKKTKIKRVNESDAACKTEIKIIEEFVENIQEDLSVVKTIVISKGFQNCKSESIDTITNKERDDFLSTGAETMPGKVELHDAIIALATSTPSKLQDHNEFGSILSGSSCNDNTIAKNVNRTNELSVDGQTDVPDVRIMIKKRRSIRKR